MAHPAGLDHSFLVPSSPDLASGHGGLQLAAELHQPASGRTVTVATDQPDVHVYTGNHLGPPFARHSAVCLETQRFPDAPNRPALGPAVLRPGEQYLETTRWRFGTT